MNAKDRERLRIFHVEIVKDLDPEPVLDQLYQNGELSDLDVENIRSLGTRASKVRELLTLMIKKSKDLQAFYEGLQESCHTELLEKLKNAEVTTDIETQTTPTDESLAGNAIAEDFKLRELKTKLSLQTEVVKAIHEELSKIQTDLKRASQSYDGNTKYKKCVDVLSTLELESSEQERILDEFHKILLKDINQEDEEEEEIRSSGRPSRQSSLARPHRISFANAPTIKRTVSIKCVITGDGSVGKTSIVHQFMHKKPLATYTPTVFDNRKIEVVRNSTLITINFWDTAGQEDYDRLRTLSYRETDVAIIVFSVRSPSSLNNTLVKWYPELKHFCSRAPIILVGNHTDPPTERELNSLHRKGKPYRIVEAKEAHNAARVIGAVSQQALLCSALTGDGVPDLLEKIIHAGMKNVARKNRKREKLRCRCM